MFRMLTLGGIAGPVLFAAVVMVCAALRPDYSHVSQFISELGKSGSDRAWLMNYAGFMAPGALIALSGLGLAGRFPKTALTLIGSALVALFGAGIFAAGVFSCEPTCLSDNSTRQGVLHDIVSLIAFLAMIAAGFVWGFQFRRMPGWRGFARYSFLTAALAAILLALMVAIAEIRPIVGVIQRLFLGILFLWLVLVAVSSAREDGAGQHTF